LGVAARQSKHSQFFESPARGNSRDFYWGGKENEQTILSVIIIIARVYIFSTKRHYRTNGKRA
jgi:hypothetical protein